MAEFNPFTHLLDQESLPPEHKKAVMETIDLLKVMADMMDLFSVKQAKTNSSLFGGIVSRGNKDKADPATGSKDTGEAGQADQPSNRTTGQQMGERKGDGSSSDRPEDDQAIGGDQTHDAL